MRRRLTALILTAALFLFAAPAALGAEGYSDVPETHWAAADIREARELGILTGLGEGRFGLGRPMGRAAFVTALVRLFGWESVDPTGTVFEDVAAGDWFAAPVETAAARGVLPGYTDEFRPLDPITREELVVMTVRALGYQSLAASLAAECPFPDVTSSQGYITLAADLGLAGGYQDGSFRPDAPAPREQAAAVLMRLCRRLSTPVRELASPEGRVLLTEEVPSPEAGEAPAVTALEALYRLLRSAEPGAVLALSAGGWEIVAEGETVLSARAVPEETVAAYRERPEAEDFYAAPYLSRYLTLREGERTVTVWYQTPETLAAKLRLAGLFGVTEYYLA